MHGKYLFGILFETKYMQFINLWMEMYFVKTDLWSWFCLTLIELLNDNQIFKLQLEGKQSTVSWKKNKVQ